MFAAAHELYHIWYEHNPDILPSDLLNEKNKTISEKKANRFTIKDILQLAALFTVPYRTMVKRLEEIGVMGVSDSNRFLTETEDFVEKYRKRYAIVALKPDERIAIDNLVELAVNAYENEYITYEKLEYLLDMSNLKPEDIGIKKKLSYLFPSDNELDSIMEE